MATTASLLPTFPRIFFVYIEPIAISYGIYMTLSQSTALQSVRPPLPTPTLSLATGTCSHLVSMLLFSMIILLYSPPSKLLAKLNIWVLIIADFTHWAGLFWTIACADPRGWAGIFDTGAWSEETWTLVLYPVGTLAVKFATLMGVFGRIRG